MNQLFFLNVSVVLIGLVYVIRLICFRIWRAYFASKFKPGTITYNAYARDMKLHTLVGGILGLVVLSGCLVLTIRGMERTLGDQAGSTIQGLTVGAVILVASLLTMAYAMLKDK